MCTAEVFLVIIDGYFKDEFTLEHFLGSPSFRSIFMTDIYHGCVSKSPSLPVNRGVHVLVKFMYANCIYVCR